MNKKPYKRFESLLLTLVMLIPVLITLCVVALALLVVGPFLGVGAAIALLVAVIIVTLTMMWREVRSLRKEHEASVARVQRFSKNLKKGDEK